MARLSRRRLIGASTCTAAAGIAAMSLGSSTAAAVEVRPEPSSDAPLLALCDRFLLLQAAIDASYAREAKEHRALERQGAAYEQLNAMEERHEAERAPACDEQVTLLDEIGELSASTLAGQRARARVLMAWYSLDKGSGHHSALEWCRLAPLFRDLLGEAV